MFGSSNATFDPYIDRFEEHYGRPISDIPINFVKLQQPKGGKRIHLAFCMTYTEAFVNMHVVESFREIVVDAEQWWRLTNTQREILIFHELGHCELGREHDRTVFETGIPTTLMNPDILNPFYYLLNKKYYIDELFQFTYRKPSKTSIR